MATSAPAETVDEANLIHRPVEEDEEEEDDQHQPLEPLNYGENSPLKGKKTSSSKVT
jgi:hypothetical protein